MRLMGFLVLVTTQKQSFNIIRKLAISCAMQPLLLPRTRRMSKMVINSTPSTQECLLPVTLLLLFLQRQRNTQQLAYNLSIVKLSTSFVRQEDSMSSSLSLSALSLLTSLCMVLLSLTALLKGLLAVLAKMVSSAEDPGHLTVGHWVSLALDPGACILWPNQIHRRRRGMWLHFGTTESTSIKCGCGGDLFSKPSKS